MTEIRVVIDQVSNPKSTVALRGRVSRSMRFWRSWRRQHSGIACGWRTTGLRPPSGDAFLIERGERLRRADAHDPVSSRTVNSLPFPAPRSRR